MKALLLITITVTGIFTAFSQDRTKEILEQIERNNTTLAAVRAETDARVTGNQTGLLPPNPEVEFNYLWGNPSAIGNRTDFSVLQSFDFPTAYIHRSEIASLKNEQAKLEYLQQRNALFHEARMLMAGITYHNALIKEYSTRLHHADQMVDNYKRRLEVGEGNILDYNKATLNRLTLAAEQENLAIERRALTARLESLNGGKTVEIAGTLFNPVKLLLKFEQWIEQVGIINPSLQLLEQEVAVAEKQSRLNKALGLPKFQAGYMSERVVGEQFQGLTAGVSIPLWENKNRVKFARATAEAVATREADARFQFYNEMESLYQKAVALQFNIVEYEARLQDFSNRALLDKALNAGQISLSEYLLELAVYYQSVDKLLEMKYELLVAWYALNRFS